MTSRSLLFAVSIASLLAACSRDRELRGDTDGGSGGGDAQVDSGGMTTECEPPASPFGVEAACRESGLCFTYPLPQGLGLIDVHGSSACDVWAVGAHGAAVHWDGFEWRAVDSGTTADVTGIWAASPGEAYAVTSTGRILRWDGSAFLVETTPPTAALNAVWGSGAGDVWAVGEAGAILRREAGAWTTVASGVTTTLRDVWGSAADDAWAVGDGGVVLHWDGSAWAAISGGPTDDVRAVFGSARDDVWLSGGSSWRFDGTTWRMLEVGICGGIGGVAFPGDSALVAAGSWICRWNGSSWDSLAENDGFSPVLDVRDVWGPDPSAIFAVGEDGVIEHRVGGEWSRVVGAPEWVRVTGLSFDSPTSGWAAGGSLLLRWDGTAWSIGADPEVIAGPSAVWAAGPNDVWVEAASGRNTGIYHFDGSTWTLTQTFSSTTVHEIWGASPTSVFVVTSDVIYRWDGSSWISEMPRASTRWVAIHGTSPTDVWALGMVATVGSPVVAHFDGAAWTAQVLDASYRLADLYVAAPNDVWMVGQSGLVLRGDGTTWSPIGGIPTGAFTRVVVKLSPLYVVIGGDTGIVHMDGESAELVDTIPIAERSAFTIAPDGTIWLAPGDASILRRVP